MYKYKSTLSVLPLAMVDDLIGVSKCGIDSFKRNTFINKEIEMKKCRLHVPDVNVKSKYHKMYVGRKHDTCPVLKVHSTIMEEVILIWGI